MIRDYLISNNTRINSGFVDRAERLQSVAALRDQPLSTVDSNGGRNSVVKTLGRSRVTQSLSGALAKLPSD